MPMDILTVTTDQENNYDIISIQGRMKMYNAIKGASFRISTRKNVWFSIISGSCIQCSLLPNNQDHTFLQSEVAHR